jgi:ribonuclease HIII
MAHRVIQFDLRRADELRRELEAAGFELRDIQHAVFGAHKPGLAVTLYRRGKLVLQGNQIEAFLERFLPGESFPEEGGAASSDTETVLGTDESGKGDYFGPLIVAGVLVPPGEGPRLREQGAADSKRLADMTALRLSDWIRERYPHAVVSLPPEEYNRRYEETRNLNRLLAELHAQVIREVTSRHRCDRVITDQFGDESLVRLALGPHAAGMRLEQRPGAEAETAVAAGSILARAEFLRVLQELRVEAGIDLPKGASAEVERAARDLVSLLGRDALRRFAKLHFKTTQKIGTLFG